LISRLQFLCVDLEILKLVGSSIHLREENLKERKVNKENTLE
jgi:hypothetical protein